MTDTRICNSEMDVRAIELIRELLKAGLTLEALALPLDDPETRSFLVRSWLSCADRSTSPVRAREIMDDNFFGIDEAAKHYRMNPSAYDVAPLARVPFSEEQLIARAKTHVLVACFPLSIFEIYEKGGAQVFYPSGQNWCSDQFTNSRAANVAWQLICKTPVHNSTTKTWREQQTLLGEAEMIPRSSELTYLVAGHYRNTGQRLFEDLYVQCADSDGSDGGRILIGYFGPYGLHVDTRWRDSPSVHVGLPSMQRAAHARALCWPGATR